MTTSPKISTTKASSSHKVTPTKGKPVVNSNGQVDVYQIMKRNAKRNGTRKRTYSRKVTPPKRSTRAKRTETTSTRMEDSDDNNTEMIDSPGEEEMTD